LTIFPGTNSKIILESNLGWPNALAIDYTTRQLFFGDAREDMIGSVDFDGSNLRIILSRGMNPSAHLQVCYFFLLPKLVHKTCKK
jgi:hypothetical protein